MAQNYVLLDRIELNQSASSVTFSSIPQTGYTDLKLVISARSDRSSVVDDIAISFNGSTASFTGSELYGDGSSAASITTSRAAGVADGNTATASTFGNTEIYIPNYTGSTNKSFSVDGVQESNGTTSYAVMLAGLWSNTAAITSVGLAPLNGTNFLQHSTFSLYGIAAVGTTPAIAPKAEGGNVIATDGTYWYHAFLSNGTFTPQVGLSADVLVVAGGGGGGGYASGGGGGAGGLSVFTSQSLAATNYTCTVGAGGAGGPSASPGVATQGVNSQFGALTAAIGGGRGGSGGGAPSQAQRDGGSGGSGGGGGGDTSGGAAGANTSSQGNIGGTGYGSPNYPGGGGGGAGASGANGSGSGGANGGVGYYSALTDAIGAATGLGQLVSSHYYFAGGGGGGTQTSPYGTGGSGGGGNGAGTPLATSGTTNTGGGGGGTNYLNVAGSGGSGIIIIRYLVA